MAVLEFHEDGSLEGLDSDWVSYRSCGTQDSMPATLGKLAFFLKYSKHFHLMLL